MSSLKTLILLCAGLLISSFTLPAQAATFITKLADTNDGACNADCSLREAITVANAAGNTNSIIFDPTAFANKQTISTSTGLPPISSNLSIVGSVAGVTITSNGITIGSGTVTLSNLTLLMSIRAYGGNTTVHNCTIQDAAYDITIHNSSTVVVQNSTLTGNSNRGIFVFNGTVVVQNSTITGTGIGIDMLGGTLSLSNSIVAGNQTNVRVREGVATFNADDHNIISGTAVEAGLEVDGNGYPLLADNGGPTQTIKLLPSSPAIDKGGPGGPATDQRGFNRPVDDPTIAPAPGGDNSDIGAFEVGGVPALAVNNPRSLPEGSAAAPGSVTFDITLNAASTQTVTVNYQTTIGNTNPAIAGSDYVAKSGKLTFAPGETIKKVTIQFIGDSAVELNETFFFDLKTPTNAIIADNRGVGQINNDDGPGITISNAVTVDEGSSGTKPQTFAVMLSAASPNTVTVSWATANGTANGDDYVAASGTLTFAPGETSKVITIQVNGDTAVEPNETYKVNLSKVAYAFIANSQGFGTILNDDAAALLFENDAPST